MTLRRMTLNPDNTTSNEDVTVYGHIRGYAPAQLMGTVSQGSTTITISNRDIEAAGWPGPPDKQDLILFDGRRTAIQSVDAKFIGLSLVAFDIQVEG
jgi:hypothetical protein